MNIVTYFLGFITDTIFNFLHRKIRRLRRRLGKKEETQRNQSEVHELTGTLISRSMISPLSWFKALSEPSKVKRVYTFKTESGEEIKLKLPSSLYDVWFLNHLITMSYYSDEVVSE